MALTANVILDLDIHKIMACRGALTSFSLGNFPNEKITNMPVNLLYTLQGGFNFGAILIGVFLIQPLHYLTVVWLRVISTS